MSNRIASSIGLYPNQEFFNFGRGILSPAKEDSLKHSDELTEDIKEKVIRSDRENGKIVELTINNPKARNALSISVLKALDFHIQSISHEQKPEVVIVNAAQSPVFSSGHNLKEVYECQRAYGEVLKNESLSEKEKEKRLAETRQQASQQLREIFALCSKVMLSLRQDLNCPVIACVDGIATAAGFQLVASSDLVVCSSRSTFATSGINVGLFCSTPMVPISRNIPPKLMFELLVTGDFVSAGRLAELGFVNRLVQVDENADRDVGSRLVHEQAIELARKIISKGGASQKFGKQAFYGQLETGNLTRAYEIGTETILSNALDVEAIDGIGHFATKSKSKL